MSSFSWKGKYGAKQAHILVVKIGLKRDQLPGLAISSLFCHIPIISFYPSGPKTKCGMSCIIACVMCDVCGVYMCVCGV